MLLQNWVQEKIPNRGGWNPQKLKTSRRSWSILASENTIFSIFCSRIAEFKLRFYEHWSKFFIYGRNAAPRQVPHGLARPLPFTTSLFFQTVIYIFPNCDIHYGSGVTRVDGTTVHCVVIHCLHIVGPAVRLGDTWATLPPLLLLLFLVYCLLFDPTSILLLSWSLWLFLFCCFLVLFIDCLIDTICFCLTSVLFHSYLRLPSSVWHMLP